MRNSFFRLVLDENGQPIFPTDDLTKLEEQVNRIRWTIPVLTDGELIKCLRAAVRLARKSSIYENKKTTPHKMIDSFFF